MAAQRAPVLWSKLRRPQAAVDVIERTRLLDGLITPTGPVAPVIVLQAPGGYDKSTLACQAVARLGADVVWLTVDERDADLDRLWSHLSAGLDEVGVAVDRVEAALADQDHARVADEVIAAVERHERALLIVLDDVHEVLGTPALDGIGRLLTAPIDALTLVLLTRLELDLPLPRLRASGLLAERSSDDLAYDDEEAHRALAADVDAGRLSGPDAAALVDHIGGWPAGLRLAQLAVRSGDGTLAIPDFGGAHPDVSAYLAGEVFDRLDERVGEFLEATSILDDLTPGACDAVMARPGSLAVLRRLAADDVFTTLVDPVTSTFRTHRLLREYAGSRLAERPAEECAELHRRAVVWFRANGDVDATIRHAVAAGDSEVALEVLADAYLDTANAGRIDTLWQWVAAIGPELVLHHPLLGPLPAWASLNQHRYDEIEPWLSAIEMLDDVDAAHRDGFVLQADAIRSNRDRHLGRLDHAVEHGVRAAARARGDMTRLGAGPALASAGAALALVGDDRAEQALLDAATAAHDAAEMSSMVTAYAYLGLVLEDPVEADAAAASALSLIADDEQERFHRPAAAWLARARHGRREGRVGDADAAVDRGLEHARAGREPALAALLLAERARIAHLLGRDAEVRDALREADRLAGLLTGAGAVTDEVARARNATRFAPSVADDRLPVGARELTDRELAVLRLLPHGLSRRELAGQLFVSENTVKTHLTSIRRKLGLSGRADVVARARELGLLGDDGTGPTA